MNKGLKRLKWSLALLVTIGAVMIWLCSLGNHDISLLQRSKRIANTANWDQQFMPLLEYHWVSDHAWICQLHTPNGTQVTEFDCTTDNKVSIDPVMVTLLTRSQDPCFFSDLSPDGHFIFDLGQHRLVDCRTSAIYNKLPSVKNCKTSPLWLPDNSGLALIAHDGSQPLFMGGMGDSRPFAVVYSCVMSDRSGHNLNVHVWPLSPHCPLTQPVQRSDLPIYLPDTIPMQMQSPDNLIAFDPPTMDSHGPFKVSVLDLRRGGIPIQVYHVTPPPHTEIEQLSFSPHGDRIEWFVQDESVPHVVHVLERLLFRWFSVDRESYSLYVSDLKGGRMRLIGRLAILPGDGIPVNFQWLPSGKAISYSYHGGFYTVDVEASGSATTAF